MMVGDEWQRFQGPEEVRVIEELLEVGHQITKALRFGWDEMHPEKGLSNREMAVVEMRDLEFQWNELAEKVDLPKIELEKNTMAGEVVSSRDERGGCLMPGGEEAGSKGVRKRPLSSRAGRHELVSYCSWPGRGYVPRGVTLDCGRCGHRFGWPDDTMPECPECGYRAPREGV